jgi:hypothetical protein
MTGVEPADSAWKIGRAIQAALHGVALVASGTEKRRLTAGNCDLNHSEADGAIPDGSRQSADAEE